MTTNKFADLIRDNRSCRRFYQDHAVTLETLKKLVNLGRLSASGANLQPLKYILVIPAHCKILLVLAIGKPRERVELEPVDAGGSIRYWRDGDGVHHVPKRKLDDIIIGEH